MLTTDTSATVLEYSRDAYSIGFSRSASDLILCYSSYAKKVERAFAALEVDPGEPRPSAAAIGSLLLLVYEVSKTRSLFQPDVSAFYGEAVLTWRFGKREVTLLSSGRTDDPKMLKYEARDNRPSYTQMVPNVTGEQLARAIHYSLKYPGWLYE